MQLRNLFDDDSAVSPVIGVILMVAITVILAAVIATFVLGLGEQVSQTAPQASFSFDYSEDLSGSPTSSFDDGTGSEETCDSSTYDGILTITHSGGATIKADRLSLSGASGADGNWAEDTVSAYSSGDDVSAGSSIEVCVNSGDTINVVWQSQSGGDSSILRRWGGPDS